MLDLPRIQRIRLSGKPRFQRFIGYVLLVPNFNVPPKVKIELEGLERVPTDQVIFAMNHTDRYNYWPFQFRLWRQADRFTATWVKGKYYQHPMMGFFMEKTNNIPTVSRGYLVSQDFKMVAGRPPKDAEYAALRALVQGETADESVIPKTVLETPRNMLGRPFHPSEETYAECMQALFAEMMKRFVELNAEAVDKNLDLLIFPQGTRSIRLSRGHIGLAQIALKLNRPIVPVGCNGSNLVYPGSSPVAKGGSIVFRFGEPVLCEDLAPFRPNTDFEPFNPPDESRHREQFRALTDLVMGRINECLDPEYQYATGGESDGVRGVRRFL